MIGEIQLIPNLKKSQYIADFKDVSDECKTKLSRKVASISGGHSQARGILTKKNCTFPMMPERAFIVLFASAWTPWKMLTRPPRLVHEELDTLSFG